MVGIRSSSSSGLSSSRALEAPLFHGYQEVEQDSTVSKTLSCTLTCLKLPRAATKFYCPFQIYHPDRNRIPLEWNQIANILTQTIGYARP